MVLGLMENVDVLVVEDRVVDVILGFLVEELCREEFLVGIWVVVEGQWLVVVVGWCWLEHAWNMG